MQTVAPIVFVLGLLVAGCGSSGRYLGQDGAGDDDSAGGDTSTTGSSEGTGASSDSGPQCAGLGQGCGPGCCPGLTCNGEICEDQGEDDGGSQFVPTGDMAMEHMCDIWDPEDCPEGEKCTAYATAGSSWDANKCVMIEGDGMPGDDCMSTDGSGVSGHDTCAKGSMCWDIDQNTMVGYCIAFCSGAADSPMCAEGSVCGIYSNGVMPLCYLLCDPLDGGADCRNPDNLCISDPGGQGFMCTLDASGGQGTYGTECQYANSCNHGLFCANADDVPGCKGSQGCCSEFCRPEDPNTCAGKDDGQACVPWFENPPPGYEHVGGCAIPE